MSEHPVPFPCPVQVRWHDIDAYGHVNNADVVTLLEEARIRSFHAWCGGDLSMLMNGILVASQELTYSTPIPFTVEPVVVHTWVATLGGASFEVHYRIHATADAASTLYASATTHLVAYDLQAERPRRLTDAERTLLKAHQLPAS